MKQIFLLFLFASATSSMAQVKLEDAIKPGTKLIYNVVQYGSSFDFIITLKDSKGKSFDWEMTSPKNMKGTINHTDKGMQKAYKLYTLYQSETRSLDDQTLAIFLSQQIFKDLTKGTAAVKICMHNPEQEPTLMKNFMDGEFSMKINGNGVRMVDKVVRPAKKVKDKWIIDPINDDRFSYYNSPSFPVILRFSNGDLALGLKEVISN